ncbi:MAG: sulfatase [Bacteroidota bacterium]
MRNSYLRLSFYTLCILLSFSSCAEEEKEPARKPNFVIIFTDDQGYADLGVYGAKGFSTPHLDTMAQEGLKFNRFYVSQPVCSASRASLMTGCYSNRLGIHGAYFPYSKEGLNPNEETLAEVLKTQGYKTALYGKWHLGDHPNLLPTNHGFDEYYGIPYSNDMWPQHPANDYFKFDPLPLQEGKNKVIDITDQSLMTGKYTNRAVDFIRRNKDNPFFLYVPHPMPHAPLAASYDFAGKSERGLYGDVISEIDAGVGSILSLLKELNLDEHTMVIFTSDNGPWLSYGGHSGSAAPLREGKGTAWEGGVRVPCIVRWPGKVPAGVETNTPAMTIDLLPTIAKLAGADLPKAKIDGMDISPILFQEKGAENPHEGYAFYYKQNELHAVMKGDWKLYFPHTYRSLNGREGTDDGLPIKYDQNTIEAPELYNVATDISETQNVYDQHPDIVEDLMEFAEETREALGDKLTEREGSENRPVGEVVWEGRE